MSLIPIDAPLVVTTPEIDPGTLAAINQVWWSNAINLGIFCLGVGFCIGFLAGYFYLKNKM